MQIDDFNINTNILELPYTYEEQAVIPAGNEIISYTNRDGREHFNPVLVIGQALIYLDSFIRTNNDRCFELLTVYSDKLLNMANYQDGMLLFPYKFDFALHADPKNMMRAPWYSGMAQGMALSYFSRMEEFTIAECIFDSFTSPEITHYDEDNYYWIDEYPNEPPTCTLNGFIYGIYGLYDYYRLANNKACLSYLLAAITTIKKYAELYRVPGQVSIYCLAHRIPCDKAGAKYHKVHIGQFRMLYKITGDSYFKEFADNLLNDFKPDGKIRNW